MLRLEKCLLTTLLRLIFVVGQHVLFVGSGAGQSGDWPSLRELGVEYISKNGHLQFTLSGQLDLEVMSVSSRPAGLIHGELERRTLTDDEVRCVRCHSDFAGARTGGDLGAGRLRLLADLFLGEQFYAMLELRSDRSSMPLDRSGDRIEQLFLRVSSQQGAAALQVGRFASPVGSYASRHLTIADPFLRPPLLYDYPTVLSRILVPNSPESFLQWKNRPDLFRPGGASPVWNVPYQWGALVFGSAGPVVLQFGLVNSAPSSEPDAWAFDWTRLDHPSFVAGVRWQATAALGLGASLSRGPWMERVVVEAASPGWIPPPRSDFEQRLLSLDVVYARGPWVVRAEAMADRWEVFGLPNGVSERLYNAEAQWDVWPGVSVAGRIGYIDFRPVTGDGGLREDWDYDTYRAEASIAYRITRNAGLLFSGYRQSQRGADDTDGHQFGARLWWAF